MFPTKNILDKYNLRLKRNLGQNLLKDEQALKTIAEFACLSSDDFVLEIGAGIGNLSVLLAEKAKKFYALEKDRAFEHILKANLNKFKNAKIIFADILEFDLKEIFEGKKIKVIGNLPFYITSPILKCLIQQREYIKTILVTIQKEVAERIVASAGNKHYGRLTCLLQFYTKAQIKQIFPKDLFFPKPEVDSSLIQFDILEKPSVNVKSEKLFFSVVKAIFTHRRKTLLNELLAAGELNLKKENFIEILEKLKIPSTLRGEQLPLFEIGRLADEIYSFSR